MLKNQKTKLLIALIALGVSGYTHKRFLLVWVTLALAARQPAPAQVAIQMHSSRLLQALKSS